MVSDMILDCFQAKTYYRLAQQETNVTIRTWPNITLNQDQAQELTKLSKIELTAIPDEVKGYNIVELVDLAKSYNIERKQSKADTVPKVNISLDELEDLPMTKLSLIELNKVPEELRDINILELAEQIEREKEREEEKRKLNRLKELSKLSPTELEAKIGSGEIPDEFIGLNITELENEIAKYVKERDGEVSIGYFVCSVISLILPNLIIALVLQCVFLCENTAEQPGEFLCCLCLFPLLVSICLLVGNIIYFIIFPLASIIHAVFRLFRSERYEEEIDEGKFLVYLELMKMIEQFGEAIPQLIIASIFFARHQDWIYENDMELFSIIPLPVPMTLISIISSTGSIIVGIVMGCRYFVKCWNELDDE